MHIQLKNGKMLNTNYINGARQGFRDKNVVIIDLTNGLKILDGYYKTNDEAKTRVEEINSSLI